MRTICEWKKHKTKYILKEYGTGVHACPVFGVFAFFIACVSVFIVYTERAARTGQRQP